LIVVRKTNARGVLVGESQPACRHADTVVAQARAMRAKGMGCRAIGLALGISHATVHDWVTNRRRNPPARIVVKRIKPK